MALQALHVDLDYNNRFALVRSLAWSHLPLSIFVPALRNKEKYIKLLESLTTTCSPTARAHSYITSGSVVQHELSELMCFDCNAAIRGGRRAGEAGAR